ncbi:MAG: deoxyribonuclease V [Micavibrio sp.]
MTIIFSCPANAKEAIAIQNDLRHAVVTQDHFETPRLIAGIDVGFDTQNNRGRASVVLLDAKTLEPVATSIAFLSLSFPYIPGLLSFREIPVILKALEGLPQKPDLLMVDGQGIAHPRRLGIAAHLGVVLDLPAIGVAKSRLTGKFLEPGPLKGSTSALMDYDEKIGIVLRSRDFTRPLFISAGHRISHESALALVGQCLTRYRLPEPTRLADKFSKTLKPKAG